MITEKEDDEARCVIVAKEEFEAKHVIMAKEDWETRYVIMAKAKETKEADEAVRHCGVGGRGHLVHNLGEGGGEDTRASEQAQMSGRGQDLRACLALSVPLSVSHPSCSCQT